MALALFDLDNTLINGDSDYAWGQFMVDQKIVDQTEYEARNEQFYQDYVAGRLDVYAYLRFALNPLTSLPAGKRAALQEQFMVDIIEPMVLPKALQLIESHRAQNNLPVVITSTNSFITAPIVKRLGIDHLIASEAEIIDGEFTGEIVGSPCFREGKLICLDTWLRRNGSSLGQTLEGAWFYSDSFNDLPLMEAVANPVAVDSDEKLTKIANERDWQVISLR